MRKEKQLLLNEIKEKIDTSKGMIVTAYRSLTPNLSWAFRGELAKSGSQFEVVRKRVFLKAAHLSGIQIDEKVLSGHVGVVFVPQDDTLPVAKAVLKFSEENSKVLELLCGQVEGNMLPGSEVEALSKLPGMNELRAMLIGLLVAPMAQMLSVLDAAMAGPLATDGQQSQKE